MMSILPQCSKLCLKTASTVERMRTSQRRGRNGDGSEDAEELGEAGESECMLESVSVKLRPTAVTRSEWASAALTTERPMWPVAPNT